MSYDVYRNPSPQGITRLEVSRRGRWVANIAVRPEDADELIRILTTPHTTDPGASYDTSVLMAGTEPAPQEET